MLNFEHFFTAVDHDPESISLVLATYLEEYHDAGTTFKHLFETKNWDELYLLAHSLKGILASFGADTITPILGTIEKQTQGGNATEVEWVDEACVLLADIQKQVGREQLKWG